MSASAPSSSLSTFLRRSVGGVSVLSWLSTAGVAAAGAVAALYWAKYIKNKSATIPPNRPLHWVLKVSDLKAHVEFYSDVLGLSVQRHEEFDKGCEATCNGPYSGWWSKTMLSATSEEDFSLELTYNYGVDHYDNGNDLIGIHVAFPGAADRARKRGLEVTPVSDGVVTVANPDGQRFYLDDKAPFPDSDPFLYISLHTADLNRAIDYYTQILGMKIFRHDALSALLGYAPNKTCIELVQLPAGQQVDHGTAFGRIAFGAPSGQVVSTFNRATASGDTVLNPPISLSTPGKAQVVVTIVKDRDGTEICIVDDNDFRALSERKPGDEVINWESRSKRITAQKKFQKAFMGGK